MQAQNRTSFLRLMLSLVGVVGVCALISFPGVAQMNRNRSSQLQAIEETAPVAGGAPRNSTSQTKPTSEAAPTSEEASPSQTQATTEEAAPEPAEATTQTGSETIVALASTNDSFKTLTAALKAAGLTDTLSGSGPFTVFAPTDEAFAALPAGTLQELLKPENKATLVKVLTYHVVPGKVLSSDLKSGEVKTVEGSPVKVSVDSASKKVTVNNADVVQPDIQASNGVIHVIDKVILPPELTSGGGSSSSTPRPGSAR